MIWRRATVIAILKPNKPKDDPKSCMPISLLCIPYKIVERLIYNRISPVIYPQLPQEQAGFRPGRSTLDQVAKLTSDIEQAFDGNLKGGAVFVDVTADTLWRRGLTLKLLRMLPNRHMVPFISELISNHSVVVKTSDGQQSRLKRINNRVPQGSVLSPPLFNGYIADLPETNSKKCGYADDLALLKVHQDWNTFGETLTQDMSILSSWLKQWRLKLSEAKTVSSTFHLNNREANRELNVNISGRRLTCLRTPTYLGVKLYRTLTYRLRWFGHLHRMPSTLPVRRVFDFNPTIHGWKRPRGRPKTRWADSVKHDLHSAGLDSINAARLVYDRPQWKAFVCGLPTLEPEHGP